MPIRELDPFKDPTSNLNPTVNPFMDIMRTAAVDGSLPLAFGPSLAAISDWTAALSPQGQGQDQDQVQQLVVEVGCHKGDTLCALAKDHPSTGFVGLDITFKRVVETARKAKKHNLSNVKSILANGQALPKVFRDHLLDGIIVFFPDPWARKKRQLKKRLVNQSFVTEMTRLLKPGGFFWFKTDHVGYFQEVAELLAGNGFSAATEIQSPFPGPTPVSSPAGTDYGSRFQEEFAKRSVPFCNGVWFNKPPTSH